MSFLWQGSLSEALYDMTDNTQVNRVSGSALKAPACVGLCFHRHKPKFSDLGTSSREV